MGIIQYPIDCTCSKTVWIGQWAEFHICKCGKKWKAYDKIQYTEIEEVTK